MSEKTPTRFLTQPAEARTIRHYDDVAVMFSTLEEQMAKNILAAGFLKAQEMRMDRFTQQVQGDRVLAVGCGTAHDAPRFSRRGFKFVGIDISPGMLAEAVQRDPTALLSRMNMRLLGFRDNSFDGVWAPDSISHLPAEYIGQTLAEIYRVLQPHGPAYMRLIKYDPNFPPHTFHMSYWKRNEFEGLLKKAGFTINMAHEDKNEIEFLASARKDS